MNTRNRSRSAVSAEIRGPLFPPLLVYNKIDRLSAEPRVEHNARVSVWISASQRLGLDLLKSAIAERLELAGTRGSLQCAGRG